MKEKILLIDPFCKNPKYESPNAKLGYSAAILENAGYETVIYFNRELGYFNYDLSQINNYHFWLAEYFSTPSFYYDYKIWQYTDKGSVDGIKGSVDLNISLVDYSSKGVVG